MLIVTVTTALAQQNAVIHGQITDSATGEGLIGATVLIQGTNQGSATNVEGNFRIAAVRPGSYTLIVSYLGYQTQTLDVTVGAGDEQRLDIELNAVGLEGEEILFSVQAQGQRSAINQQLRSQTISNIVARERIQEMPDVNAAESIGRLPGVSIQRSGGEANRIAIRGLSPKYNTVTVNGVRVPATGGDDRAVDLSLISSNMLDGIEVTKALLPYQDADALGGSVDLRLREAPDELRFDVSAQGGYNHLQEHLGNYQFTGTVSNRFFDSRMGAIVNFNLDSYDRSADKLNANYRRQSTGAGDGFDILVSSLNLREESVTRGRTGASVLLDFRIPYGKITANTFYNQLTSDALFRVNRMDLNANRHYYDFERRGGETDVWVTGLGIEQNYDWIEFDASVAFTSTTHNSVDDMTWHFVREGGAFHGSVNPNTDLQTVPDLAVNDSTRTELQSVFDWDTDRFEQEYSTQFNFKVPFSFSDQVSGHFRAGGKLRWLERENDEYQYGRAGLHYDGGGDGIGDILRCVDDMYPEYGIADAADMHGNVPMYLFFDGYQRDDFLAGDYPLGFTVDETMVTNILRAVDDCGYANEYTIGSYGRDYYGTEQYQAAYLMAEINIGNMITLIPGLRYEGEISEYTGRRYREVVTGGAGGVQQPPQELTDITVRREHNFFLPNVHLQIRPIDWLSIRLAYTESLTRPDYIQYAPNTTMNSYRSYVRAANTDLKPAHAQNYDISASVYNNTIGLFTVSGFYKSIDDLIFQVGYRLRPGVDVLDGLQLPDSWVDNAPSIDTYINNPFEAIYRGIELDWQTHFWYLPGALQGITLNINYTHIFSETEYGRYETVQDGIVPGSHPPRPNYVLIDTSRTGRMPDQPSHIANVTLGYDYKGFSGRLSFLYQTDVTRWIAGHPVLDEYTGDYARLDLMLRQEVIENLQVYANFNNLNNRPDRNFQGSASGRNPSYIEYYGFTMDLGVRYRF